MLIEVSVWAMVAVMFCFSLGSCEGCGDLVVPVKYGVEMSVCSVHQRKVPGDALRTQGVSVDECNWSFCRLD